MPGISTSNQIYGIWCPFTLQLAFTTTRMQLFACKFLQNTNNVLFRALWFSAQKTLS